MNCRTHTEHTVTNRSEGSDRGSALTHPGEEESVVEEVVELLEALLHCLPPGLWQVQLSGQGRHVLTREKDPLCIGLVVQ